MIGSDDMDASVVYELNLFLSIPRTHNGFDVSERMHTNRILNCLEIRADNQTVSVPVSHKVKFQAG